MSRITSECAPCAPIDDLKLLLLPVELKVNKKLPPVKPEANANGKIQILRKKCIKFSSNNKDRQLLGIILLNQSNYHEKIAGKYYLQNSE